MAKMKYCIFLLFVIMCNIGFAQLMPPHQFYGNVIINGAPAHDGIEIIAKIENLVFKTYTKNGKYGYDPLFKIPSDNPLTSEKDGGKNGDIITFYVGNIEVANYVFESGSITNIDFKTSSFCGDKICNENENHITCPSDCVQVTTTIYAATGGGGISAKTKVETNQGVCNQNINFFIPKKIIINESIEIPVLINVSEDCNQKIKIKVEMISWKFGTFVKELLVNTGVHSLKLYAKAEKLYTTDTLSIYTYVNDILHKKYEVELIPMKTQKQKAVLLNTTETRVKEDNKTHIPTGLVVAHKKENNLYIIFIVLIIIVLIFFYKFYQKSSKK